VVYLLKQKSHNQELGGSTVNQGDFFLPHSSNKRNYLKFPTIMALFYVLKSCKWDFEDDKIQPNNLGLNNYLQSPNKQNTFGITVSLKGLFSIILCEPLTIKYFL
jgi:hypothetical protein